MSSEEFRESLKHIVKTHDVSADDLRDTADDLETLADRWDATEDIL